MSTPHRFVAGAIDLGELKAHAEAKAAVQSGSAASGVAPITNLLLMAN